MHVPTTAVSIAESAETKDPVVPEPTEQELLLHLLKHCPNLESLELNGWRATDADVEFWKTIANDVVPNLANLGISFEYRLVFNPDLRPEPIKTKDAETDDSIHQSILAIGGGGREDAEDRAVERVQRNGPLTALKHLHTWALDVDRDWSGWSRFLRRCVHLESLSIEKIDRGWVQALRECTHLKTLYLVEGDRVSLSLLAETFRTNGLPNLDDIVVSSVEGEIDDVVALAELADMLSACRKGWRSVAVPTLDTFSADALVQHCPTLESLKVTMTPGLTSTHIRQILSSSPNLHTFVTAENGEAVYSKVMPILAEDFIDLDPATDTLRPWPCESKLKLFNAKVLGIPRPDVTLTYYGRPREEFHDVDGNAVAVDVLQETHPGQGRELQRRVYERLSRFTHLEVLGLGHDVRGFGGEGRLVEDAEGVFIFGDKDYQYECLEMSLDAGLWLLEGLKELQILNVMRMTTSIGIEEVQWMAESWPKFELLNGLNTEGVEAEAGNWLKERGDALVGLRNLVIARNPKSGDYSGWSRFLKRWICLESLKVENIHPGWFKALGECTHIKRLHLVKAYRRYLQLLTHTLRTGLPNVDVIEIDHTEEEREDSVFLVFASLTDLLSACRKEWRSVAVLILDRLTVDALVKHFPTLESLKATITPGLMSAHLRQILSSSPNLHTLITLNDKETDFIDLDPATNALKPCPYESKLKHFSAKVLGIPRPDVTLTYYGRPFEEADVDMLQEIHFGQSRELRRRVYKRLSRLTQLEVLRLGHDDRDFKMNDDSVEYGEGQFIMDDKHYQYGCLEVSLDIGLRMLESLKELRVLNVMRMTTSTGVEEVRLMAENWPKLKEIHGLYPGGIELDAENWLWENCPRIDVTSYLLNNR
ncbi:hypothetical protein BGX23_010969 [Mortierella sp. AD031]|nr:hypothetical protein BGX23_010969 [Mortierella sp. AD031]